MLNYQRVLYCDVLCVQCQNAGNPCSSSQNIWAGCSFPRKSVFLGVDPYVALPLEISDIAFDGYTLEPKS